MIEWVLDHWWLVWIVLVLLLLAGLQIVDFHDGEERRDEEL